MESSKPAMTALVGGIVVALCCICLIVVGLGGYIFYSFNQAAPTADAPDFPFDEGTATPAPALTRPPIDANSIGTVEILENTIVPPNEPAELACRLEGKCDIPKTLAAPAAPRTVDETDTFWVSNVETNENFEVNATLRYVTPHVYFWVEDGVTYDEGELKSLADAFETKIYPTNREFFGSEWSPGIDSDEHIYILYAGGLGMSIAGYFSSADEVHPLAHEYSNAHEMFLFNSDNTNLGDEFTYGVLAHEFQHMIHWSQDLNETSWLNEGSSELAAFLNQYDPGGFDWLYISDPDLQLNDWPNDQNATTPHYGAGFLYLTYFLDRFGEDATKALVRDPANGFDSVENVLREIDAVDALTGQPISADDFFMDWAVTNLLLDDSVEDGRYIYHNYPGANRATATETISTCPQSVVTRNVHQYGVDYIAIECPGDYTLSFTGSTITNLLPADAYSGDYAFWSNKGDESDMTLTHEFDFTQASGPVTLSFRTWYDLETDYDYLYLEVSEDGKTWQIITTPSGTSEDPSGNSFGWGYNGVTNDWIEESVDLSAYAGKKVFVRFEYITDAAVNGEGLLLDDVSIDAINYKSDFEADDGGWTADGFVRVQNVLPQTFRLSLVLSSDSSVQVIPVNDDQTAEIPISLKSGETAFLVVSGTTRFTRESATYQIEIK
ncbi:MAG: immune inhibitor A [Chloroflexi bacterium]|nr:immune inhibitor A [Chloroflexota bacterium]